MGQSLRRLRFVAGFLVVLALILLVSYRLWLPWFGEYLTYTEPPCKADMIVVLAGDLWGNRVRKAGELLKQGWAPQVLMSGAGSFYGINEGEMGLRLAAREGYPVDRFFNLPSTARSTREESVPIIAELRKRQVHRYILVTSDFHTRRAAAIYRKQAPDLPFCVVASPDPDFSPDRWWYTREGRKTAFFEWCKTIAGFLGI